MGLFGKRGENSKLCNIRTTGSVSMTGYYAGGIVANTYGNVVNCHNEASVTGVYHVGGIVGLSGNSEYIINCSNSGDIEGSSNVGGIVGNISTMKVINCLHKKAQTNKWRKEKIRQTLQCNPVHFQHTGRGMWRLRRVLD